MQVYKLDPAHFYSAPSLMLGCNAHYYWREIEIIAGH